MEKNEALQRCMKLCSTKEYAPKEMVEKMISWGVSDTDVNQIIEMLIADNYIDIKRYARSFVNDKIKFNKWGRIKIGLMLKHKGLDNEVINEAFSLIDDNFYIETLQSELIKKYRTIKTSDPYVTRGKLYQFAAGRGFEGDLVHKVIDKIIT